MILESQPGLAVRLQALDERWRTEPEVVQAETLAWMRAVRSVLEDFRRVNGRHPRGSEVNLVLGGSSDRKVAKAVTAGPDLLLIY